MWLQQPFDDSKKENKSRALTSHTITPWFPTTDWDNINENWVVTDGTNVIERYVWDWDTWNALSISSSPVVPVVNKRAMTIYIDSVYWDDATWVIDDYTKQFKTFDAWYSAYLTTGKTSIIFNVAKWVYTKNTKFDLHSDVQIKWDSKWWTRIDTTFAWSFLWTHTVWTRIYNVWIENITIRNTAWVGVWLDMAKISTSKFMSVSIRWFATGLSIKEWQNYYNNFYDFDVDWNDINIDIDDAWNENHFYGWRVANAGTTQLVVDKSNQVIFNWVAFEWNNQVFNVLWTSEDIHFTNCRFEEPAWWTAVFTFWPQTKYNSILNCRKSWPVTIVDNWANQVILNHIREVRQAWDNLDWALYERKWAWQREHAVHTAWASYANSGSPTWYRAISRRFGSKAFEAVWDNGTDKLAKFWVNIVDWSIVTSSPDGSAWKISVNNLWALVVTADTPYTLP